MKNNSHKTKRYQSTPLARKIIELIKQELSLVEVAGEFTDLRRSGNKLVGACPFCSEGTDSFGVFPEYRSYYCSRCLREGDVFRFIMDIDQVTFRDAFKIILSRYCGL
ncbi:MAG: CHC2 zinc finger domain-containing protein [Thermodesulfobacteriota bacterium]